MKGNISMDFYHVAQICKNGHLVNSKFDTSPNLSQQYCPICGAQTITACPECGSPLHGEYEVDGIVAIGFQTNVDAYCYSCGKPYPWTKSALLSASAIIYEEENLSDELKQSMVDSLEDIITETPNTTLASVRMKRCIHSAGKFTADALRQFVIDFGCDLVKKTLGL